MTTLTTLHAAVCRDPQDDQARRALGEAYATLKQPDEALRWYEEARACNPSSAEHWAACAALLGEAKRVDTARRYYERALELAPGAAKILAAFGRFLTEHFDDRALAEAALVESLLIEPSNPVACTALGRLALERMTPEAAVGHLDAKLGGRVHPASIRGGVGSSLLDAGRYEEARALYESALAHAPASGPILNKLAGALVCLDEQEEAARTLARAVAASPASGLIFMAFVEQLIRLERLDEAMRICRERAAGPLPFGAFRRMPKDSAHPDWRGEPVRGRTLLLRTNPRYGDALQFARFASLFRDAGATVVVEALPPLAPLLRTLDGADLVIAPYEEPPPIDFDLHPALGSMLLSWTWESLADRLPCVHPPASLVLERSRRLSETPSLHVGVNWQGAPLYDRDPHRYRSMPFPLLAPISRVPGVTLHGLQAGAALVDARDAPFPIAIETMTNFLDTAAAIAALDLTVTVDTAVAHVAGTLGKRCFVMLPYRSCWRWLDRCGVSVVYPSLRLYRQPRPGDWSSVVDAVTRDVARLAAGEDAPAAAALLERES
jgi:Flp pilus assembly protein TadD